VALLNPPEILPNLAHAMYVRITEAGPMDEVALSRCFVRVKADAVHFDITLDALVRLGILRTARGRLEIARSDVHFSDAILASVAGCDAHEMWNPGTSGDAVTQVGSMDLARGLAWFMQQDLFRMSGRWDPPLGVNQLQVDQLGRTLVFTNDTRWNSFVRWSLYLGCALPLYASAQVRLFPDPTRLIRNYVRALPVGSSSVESFIDALSARFPFLDRGTLFEAVAAKVSSVRNPKELSYALSLALLRLEREKCIGLRDPDDAPKLVFRHGSRTSTYSRIDVLS